MCRTASLNIEGASPIRDHTSVGGIIGLYCLRWRATYAFLTEVPLRRGVESELNRGLAPYGYACRCPPAQGGLGVALVYPNHTEVSDCRSH